MGAVIEASDRDVEDLNQARNALDRALSMLDANSRSLTLDDVELALKLLTKVKKRLFTK